MLAAQCAGYTCAASCKGLQVAPVALPMYQGTYSGWLYIYDRRVEGVLIQQSETTPSSMLLGLMSIRNLLVQAAVGSFVSEYQYLRLKNMFHCL